jgi:hypothetical protein
LGSGQARRKRARSALANARSSEEVDGSAEYAAIFTTLASLMHAWG